MTTTTPEEVDMNVTVLDAAVVNVAEEEEVVVTGTTNEIASHATIVVRLAIFLVTVCIQENMRMGTKKKNLPGMDDQSIRRPPQGNQSRERTLDDGTITKCCR